MDPNHGQSGQSHGLSPVLWSGQGLRSVLRCLKHQYPIPQQEIDERQSIRSELGVTKRTRPIHRHIWLICRLCPVVLGHTSHLRVTISRGCLLLLLNLLLLVFLPSIHPLDLTDKLHRKQPGTTTDRIAQLSVCLSFLSGSFVWVSCLFSSDIFDRDQGKMKKKSIITSPITAWTSSYLKGTKRAVFPITAVQ